MTMKHDTDASAHSIRIIYEDDFVLVLNKPSGILTHRVAGSNGYSISDWIKSERPQLLGIGVREGEDEGRSGIVHRLDKETSGVLLIAKTEGAYLYLKKLFATRRVQKEYHALVYGIIKEERGVITKPIGRSTADFRKRSSLRLARGEKKEAITHFSVDERTPEATFVKVFPKTGRTHQIRVHMKAIHHPVLSDPLYAHARPPLFGMNRLALHAYRLSYVSPDGDRKEFIAPYPEDFADALRKFRASLKK